MQEGNAALNTEVLLILLSLCLSGFLFDKYSNTTQHKGSCVKGLAD